MIQVPEIAEILSLLQIEDQAGIKRVQKFVRTNGAQGLLAAARETSVAMQGKQDTLGAIVDPWGYCLGVVNHDAARAVALHPYLALFENALRVRVDRHLSTSRSTSWHVTPERHLPDWIVRGWTTKDVYRNLQVRSDGADGGPYELKRFASGLDLVTELSLSGLAAIAKEIHRTSPHALFPANPAIRAYVYTDQAINRYFGKITPARDAVAHHRGLRKATFEEAKTLLCELLERMEFDHEKAVARLLDKVSETHIAR